VAKIRETVAMGADISLQRSHDLWALINVKRYADGRMQFTVVPIPYGGWQLKKGQGSFTLQSPEELLRDYKVDLNLVAGLPIVRDPSLANALAEYKAFRRKALAASGDDQAALAGPELIRFDPDAEIPAEKTATKPEEPAKAVPGRGQAPGRAVPTPAPAVPLPPRPLVQAKPPVGIIGAMPSTVATPALARQPVPAPGGVAAAAAGRVLSTAEASGLVDRFAGGEPAVLSGDFVVTGILGRRVALRTREALRDPSADPSQPGNNAALIVVDFPETVTPPLKDSTLTRDAAHGFVIRDVIRGRNGQITIVAAERSVR
jgi:hypothetical protein